MLLGAGQDQVLHVVAESEADGAANRIMTLAVAFDDSVAGIIDHIRIVPCSTTHGVGTCAAIQEVVAAIACQNVG